MQNHVLDPIHDSEVASLVDGGQVSSAEPAIRKGFQAGLWQLPVPFKDSGPSALDLPNLKGARLQWLAFWAHQAYI